MSSYYHEVKKYFFTHDQQKLYNIKNPFAVGIIAAHIYNIIDFSLYNNVLELGCGDGAVSCEIATKFPLCTFTCIDSSEKSVEYAKNHNAASNCEYICADVLEIHSRITHERYDAIFSFGLAQYITHDDFIKLNISLLPIIDDRGIIAHFSIPDIRKKFATIVSQYSLNNNFFICIFKSFLSYLHNPLLCEYEDDGHSLWHSPKRIIKGLNDNFLVSAITPSDLWYRFDLVLSPIDKYNAKNKILR